MPRCDPRAEDDFLFLKGQYDGIKAVEKADSMLFTAGILSNSYGESAFDLYHGHVQRCMARNRNNPAVYEDGFGMGFGSNGGLRHRQFVDGERDTLSMFNLMYRR